MKKAVVTFIFCCSISACFSQAGQWVWIKGDSIPNQPGNFGIQGVPSIANKPPSLYEACEWTDLNGNFWMFGGVHGFAQEFADLWKYNPITNQWTWMKGSGTISDPGNYGTQGVSSPTNNPSSRGFGMNSWTDSQGNLWLFGGCASAGPSLCDLWKYDIATNEWTWMKGPNGGSTGVYGVQGVPNSANYPAGRSESAASWVDNAGNLWLFGGYEFATTACFNDLWRYTIATNTWTWMKGSQFPGQAGIYGIQGIEAPANTPGARWVYSHWKDNSGKMWLFAGTDCMLNNYNDLWRYNPATNNWTWIMGSTTTGNYGTKCIISPANMPAKRNESRATGTDANGNFWLFSGSNTFNDLWKYCPATGDWVRVFGSTVFNPPVVWGSFGVPSVTNSPNARIGANSWMDGDNFYFFGGYDPSLLIRNDLWKFIIDTTCGVCPTLTGVIEINTPDQFQIFPNPSTASFTISFNASFNEYVELKIFNILGEEVYFSKEEINEVKFEKEVDIKNFSNGIYFVQLKTNNETLNKKIVVQH